MTQVKGLPELPPTYNPSETEPVVSATWDQQNVFHADASESEDPTYSIVIPPPNVTAALHLGHALNNTLQDVLARFHRMRGKSTLWMPGTDHAGIATQTVVEKRLLTQGTSRLEIGREEFVKVTQEWKDEYEQIIINQLISMGASCDFDRTRFTMDEMCATAVRHAFFILFQDGLIYRGKRLVNWDPVTRTALADDEVEMEEIEGHMWYLRYPLEDGSGHVATTRPETMVGDTAVAINPKDPRADALVGKTVILPIADRVIPIIADDYVIMEDEESDDPKAKFASGFLKVTPAHDPNDWDIGLRHGLNVINVLGPDGSISEEYGWDDASPTAKQFVGLSRDEARVAIVDWFDQHDLLAEVREYTHSVGHSYRSHAPIEPWLSDQWYVAVTDDRLRGSALRAQRPDQVPDLPDGVSERSSSSGDGELTFYPNRYARTYYSWHDGIRDWCISRQLWWGHQIPVWSRISDTANSPIPLNEIDLDQATPVKSNWVSLGAAHMVRRINESEIEEAVCVPPETTLQRVPKGDTAISETDLIDMLEKDGFTRDPDVLDTWFSSALWPMSTMGWPWPEDFPESVGLLEKYNPTSVLSTAREIITLWVSRMVMFNRYFLDGQLPFLDVFIHAMVQDGHGQKMSKSLGNGVDPRDIIFTHGADAMRFTLVQMTTDTQDVRMPVEMICPHSGEAFTPEFVTSPSGAIVAAPEQVSPTDPLKKMVSAYGVAAGIVSPSEQMPLARNSSGKFDLGRNFANKLWNATRFALKRTDHTLLIEKPIDLSTRPFADQWIAARLAQTISKLEQAMENYQFNVYADTLYDFIWHDVCDRYLEIIKPSIDKDPEQQAVLTCVLDAVLRVMHPVCPFITEALWPHVTQARCGKVSGIELEDSELLAAADWPVVDEILNSSETLDLFDRSAVLVNLIRSVRAEQNVRPKQQIMLYVPERTQELLSDTGGLVEVLAGIGEIKPISDYSDEITSPLTFEGSEILVAGLLDSVDLQAQRDRLTKLIDEKTKQIEGFESRLANPGYLKNAKAELIDETRSLLEKAKADLLAAQASLEKLE